MILRTLNELLVILVWMRQWLTPLLDEEMGSSFGILGET